MELGEPPIRIIAVGKIGQLDGVLIDIHRLVDAVLDFDKMKKDLKIGRASCRERV